MSSKTIEMDLERMEKEKESLLEELECINIKISQESDLLEDVQTEIQNYKDEKNRIKTSLKDLEKEHSEKLSILKQLEIDSSECKLTCEFCKDPSTCTKSQRFRIRCPLKNNTTLTIYIGGWNRK